MRLKIIYFLLLITFLWGCSTKKNTSLSRGYHNLTAHYNVYFNGRESFKEGVKAIEASNVDDYTQMLAVFPESKPGAESVAGSQMDRAIEKGAKLIKVHSIRKKPENRRDDQSIKYKKFLSQNEFNKWVDNAYLLIGKSHFYKREYYVAQQSFAYIFREFQEGPEWYEAEIWNARAAIELGDFAQAKIQLENYDMEGKAPAGLFGLYAATYADFYMRQGRYAEAIPFMKEAVNGAGSKYYRRRFNFILAQLYQKQKQYTQASQAYEAVIKSNPPYEMAFNAKVNRAGMLFEEGGLEAVKKEIKRLLRDKRNSDYEDQIYYALAMAYKAEAHEELAMGNFLLSIEKSIDNNHQKGMSFFELSEIYYDRPEYKPAYYYLDTAIVNLNENFPGLQVIEARHESLTDLVANINMVEREDSLLKVAAMPEQQRLALIDGIIEDVKKRQEALKKQQEKGTNGDVFYDPMMSQSYTGTQSQGGKWYFYNQTSMGMGKLEFEKLWGRRKLEDNWRRSNKQAVVEEPMDMGDPEDMFGEPEGVPKDSVGGNEAVLAVMAKEKENNPMVRDSYLKDIPSTPELWLASNKRIQSGLLNQGLIYKDELENIPYAIDAFAEYAKRYPDGDFIEDVYMNLYLCFEKQGDSQKMAGIKDILMDKFPDGEFTAYLNDPEYFEKKHARNRKMEALYQQTYTSYLFNEFEVPVTNVREAHHIDEENVLIPKFKLLAALSYAKMGIEDRFVNELEEIKEVYASSEVAPLAVEMLALYHEGRMPVQGAVTTNLMAKRTEEFTREQQDLGNTQVREQVATSYTIDHKSQHSLILLVNPEADINRLKFNIADYNFSKFLLNDYEMGKTQLPDGTPVFSVSGFNNRLEALDYFYSLRERSEIFEVDDLEYQKLYVIHGKNQEYLLSSGDVDGYDDFFAENYLSAEAFKNLEEERRQAARDALEAEKLKKQEEKRIQEEQLLPERKAQVTQQPGAAKESEETKKAASLITEAKPETIVLEKKQAPKAANQKEMAASQTPTTVAKEKSVTQELAELAEPVTEVASETELIIEKPGSPFKYEEGAHRALILFKKGHINTERIGTVFKNYTKSNYGTKYEVEHNAMGTDYYFMVIKGFANADEAKAYLNKVKLNSFLMREISRAKHYLWAISDNNFSRLSNEESFELYQQFYKSKY
ncbi:hypothetical protein [Saccharicrinis sp. 156]|uniref:type IX secretion system periplasmic lipoprotein PorW/SprE n=1 Tax=Saccharicrinis sp. 156 TaxID=3417574 RepID=UPI003D32F05E